MVGPWFWIRIRIQIRFGHRVMVVRVVLGLVGMGL